MNQYNLTQRPAWILLCGIVFTIPIIFGAVHPLILGIYIFLILVGLGGYLLFGESELQPHRLFSFWSIVPILIVFFLFLQAIPLPLGLLELLSPARAARLEMVNDLAGTTIDYAPLSELGEGALPRSFWLLSMVIYYFALTELLGQDKKRFYILCGCMVCIGSLEALYGLFQFVNPHLGILWLKQTGGRIAHGTIIYKNQYASMLNMIWPLAVGCGVILLVDKKLGKTFIYRGNSKTKMTLFVTATLLMLLAVIFSSSRGGVVSMLIISLLMLVLMPFSIRRKVIVSSLIITLVFGYIMLLGLDVLIERFSTLDTSGSKRFELYLSSLPMLWDHWLTGVGMGSYELLSPVYLKGFPPRLLYDRAHNEYLEIAIELGLPVSMLVYSWLVAGIATLGLKLRHAITRGCENPEIILIGTAAFCGLVGFLLHGFVDFGWRLPANAIYGITLLAIITTGIRLNGFGDLRRSEAESGLKELG